MSIFFLINLKKNLSKSIFSFFILLKKIEIYFILFFQKFRNSGIMGWAIVLGQYREQAGEQP